MKKSIIALILSVIMVLAMMVPAVATNADSVDSSATVTITYSLEESWTWHITPDAEVMNISAAAGCIKVGFDKVTGNDVFAIPTTDESQAIAIIIDSSSNTFNYKIYKDEIKDENEVKAKDKIVNATVGKSIPGEKTLYVKAVETINKENVQAADDTKTAVITFKIIQAEEVDE